MVEALVKYVEDEKTFKVLVYDTAKAGDPMMVLPDYECWSKKEYPAIMNEIIGGDTEFAKIELMYLAGNTKIVSMPITEFDIKDLGAEYTRIAIDFTDTKDEAVKGILPAIMARLNKELKYNFEARAFTDDDTMWAYKPNLRIITTKGVDGKYVLWNANSQQYMMTVNTKI